MTPGDPKSFCSLRTEHYLAFDIALLAQILCIRHSITATKGYINFSIDNDTVIKRLKYGKWNPANTARQIMTNGLKLYTS